MDIQELKELLEPEDIADLLNLDYKTQGGRFLVLCPFHGDRSLGSAYLKDGYFHCFSCGESMDYITLTQRVNNCSFLEALKTLGSLVGLSISTDYVDNGYSKVKLSTEELSVLKIPQANISLKKVYNASPEIYKQIVVDKAKQQLEHYRSLLEDYSDRSASKAYEIYEIYQGKISAETYSKIRDEATSRIRTCKDILERFN